MLSYFYCYVSTLCDQSLPVIFSSLSHYHIIGNVAAMGGKNCNLMTLRGIQTLKFFSNKHYFYHNCYGTELNL